MKRFVPSLMLAFLSSGALFSMGANGAAAKALKRCAEAQLRVTFGDVPGGLSHEGLAIRFTNRGQRCLIGGFPGVDGLSARKRRTVSAARTLNGYLGGLRKRPIPTISLGSGQTASAVFEWVGGPDPDLSCSTVKYLRITPPGDMRSVQRSFSTPITICSVEIHPVISGLDGGGS